MYPQNVFADPEDNDVSPVDESIPVGFPGHTSDSRFHRRLGPEGEEQDIVGPDGHTEQLPPYSRFPENVDGKGLAMSDARSGVEVEPINSNETLIPSTDESNADTTPADSSNRRTSRNLEQMESGIREQRWSEKTWKDRRNTRFCRGIFPFWVLLLAGGLVLLLAVIIGGFIGGFAARDHDAIAAAASS